MSTDINGLKPTNDLGNFFSPGTRWLNPLAKFLEDIEDERADRLETDPIYEDYRIWHANYGEILNDEGCLKLAKVVREALNNGRATRWAMEHGHPWKLNESGNAVYHIGNPCMLFSEQCVHHFAQFLENCGGFEVS